MYEKIIGLSKQGKFTSNVAFWLPCRRVIPSPPSKVTNCFAQEDAKCSETYENIFFLRFILSFWDKEIFTNLIQKR